MSIKNLSGAYKTIREQVGKAEYLFWQITRLMLLYALVSAIVNKRSDILILQLIAEFALAFALPLMRLFAKRGFISRLNMKVQTHISIMLLVTAFFGQFKGLYSSSEWYDTYMHVIGGYIFVFTGYELAEALKRDEGRLDPLVGAIAGFGLSSFFAVFWEIFEFACDSVFVDSNSQNWSAVNSEDILSLFSNIDPRRFALLDTMLDLVSGSIGSLFGLVALYIILNHKSKKDLSGDQSAA